MCQAIACKRAEIPILIGKSPVEQPIFAPTLWRAGLDRAFGQVVVDRQLTVFGVAVPRIDRNKHHLLHEMVVVAPCAAICGAEGWVDVARFGNTKLKWFRRFVTLENGIASHDTFGRVFARLDTNEFLGCLQVWVEQFQFALREQGIAIDGETIRRSFDRATGQSALHVVSAWATDLRVCLGQVAVEDKSNEITAVRRMVQS